MCFMKTRWIVGLFFAALFVTSCQKEEPTLFFSEGDKATVSLYDTLTLHLEHTPKDAALTDVRWGWVDNEAAVFLCDATLYGRSIGTSEIVAEGRINGETVYATCMVEVKVFEMTSLQLDSAECKILQGESRQLKVSYEPKNTTYPYFSWRTSNSRIATVDSRGNVKAVNPGECTIFVTSDIEGLTDNCKITVLPIEMTSLQLDSTKYRIAQDGIFYLTASIEPENTTYKDLYWSSSDENVAKVIDGRVKAVGAGTCVISVTNKDKSLTAECVVEVYFAEIISISCLEEKTLEQGESFMLWASCMPEDATRSVLRWQSSDESVAKVDETTGEVTCVGVGECMITISNTYNSVTASCHLTVLPISVKNLRLNNSSLKLAEGGTKKLSYTVTPANAANKKVKWESSDESVATVSEDGTVTGISVGEATIKATALDGSGCSDECVVEVVTQEYVENYIKDKVSITYKGKTTVSQNMGGYQTEETFYNYEVRNSGDERVYLKEVRGYGSFSGTINIGKYIEPHGEYSSGFNTQSIEWVFEMGGIEITKR